MQTVPRPRFHLAKRDEARSRVRGPRRFQPARVTADSGEPPVNDQGPIWPPPGRPSGSGGPHIQWPYYIVMLVPWLTLTAAFLMEHFKVCFMCMPDTVPLP
jgi:hypothetical protein